MYSLKIFIFPTTLQSLVLCSTALPPPPFPTYVTADIYYFYVAGQFHSECLQSALSGEHETGFKKQEDIESYTVKNFPPHTITYSCSVLGRLQVQSQRPPTSLMSCGFPQSFQVRAAVVPKVSTRTFHSTPLPIYNLPVTPPFNIT